MTSMRRRSHSASPSLDMSSSLRASTKRAHPHHTGGSVSPELSPQKRDERWRHGKRRRRELPSQSSAMGDQFGRTTSPLATTSAEFHLFPKHERSVDRRHSACHFTTSSFDFSSPFPSNEGDLKRLRSEAFWALQKSVTENGEGFVRRMRDYEDSKSRAEKRGRKRVSLVMKGPNDSDESDESDDIQIVAGDATQSFQTPAQSERSSSPASFPSDDEPRLLPSTSSISLSSSFTPALSCATSESTNSSIISLPLHPSIPTIPVSRSSAHPSHIVTSASRSEKALAALSLAMANGAGGINDYADLQLLQPRNVLDECQVGDMWH